MVEERADKAGWRCPGVGVAPGDGGDAARSLWLGVGVYVAVGISPGSSER